MRFVKIAKSKRVQNERSFVGWLHKERKRVGKMPLVTNIVKATKLTIQKPINIYIHTYIQTPTYVAMFRG